MRKKELAKLYPGVPKRILMYTINEIIATERKMSLTRAKFSKSITKREFEKFKNIIGEPIGSQNPDEFSPSKSFIIYKIFPDLSEKLVKTEINEILQKNGRKKTAKKLLPKEYTELINRLT